MPAILYNFRKKLLNKFKEKFKIIDFGPQNVPFTQFWT